MSNAGTTCAARSPPLAAAAWAEKAGAVSASAQQQAETLNTRGKMDDKLILAVFNYPELYNVTLPNYRCTESRASAWRNISLALGLPCEYHNFNDSYMLSRCWLHQLISRTTKGCNTPKYNVEIFLYFLVLCPLFNIPMP